MGTVNVSIGHDDYTLVAQFDEIELLANANAESSNESSDLFMFQHFIFTSLFHIDDFTAQW